MQKKCYICELEKELSEFHLDCTKKDGHHNGCKSCTLASAKLYRSRPEVKARIIKYRSEETTRLRRIELSKRPEAKLKNREYFLRKNVRERMKIFYSMPKQARKIRNQILKREFGINIEQYEYMLQLQDNRCGICRKDKIEYKRNLSVDHCHSTGKIRGLLCMKCNALLGMCGDNIDILLNAMDYLESHKQ